MTPPIVTPHDLLHPDLYVTPASMLRLPRGEGTGNNDQDGSVGTFLYQLGWLDIARAQGHTWYSLWMSESAIDRADRHSDFHRRTELEEPSI